MKLLSKVLLCTVIVLSADEMCIRDRAKIGFPTLRLIRYAIGHYTLDGLDSGEWRDVASER